MSEKTEPNGLLSRRQFTQLSAGAGLLAGLRMPAGHAAEKTYRPGPAAELRATELDLFIDYQDVNLSGAPAVATTVNGSLPAPVLHWREGETVRICVHNRLPVPSSIHWHGLILPAGMDGVPGLSYSGIAPGESFQYEFTLRQNGTYWYHSHSGFQEQSGLYGAIVIDSREPEPFSYDRDYVVLLSDWSDDKPERIYDKLKKQSHYYNLDERTLADTFAEAGDKGWWQMLKDRHMWNRMRMTDRDIADVTGMTYQFLMNGYSRLHGGWQGLFHAGEKIRLRLINTGAMTFFDVHIPGLKMTVVAADGQWIQPVTVDELRIGNAETYDVMVEPDDKAYCIFAQAMDRSGYALGWLTPAAGLRAEIPPLDSKPVLTHADMGMAHTGDAMADMPAHHHHDHSQMQMGSQMMGSGAPGFGSALPVIHPASERGPQVDMQAGNPQYRLDDPGVGLRGHASLGRRVLTYADLKNYHKTGDKRPPTRELQLHLTGNMARYLWSIDGERDSGQVIQLQQGERVRITLVNDTMMNHPIHLHGLWSELETGDGDHIPRKHTVIVQPGSKISYLVTADSKGRWAYHCHLLYHMAGMFRVVEVV